MSLSIIKQILTTLTKLRNRKKMLLAITFLFLSTAYYFSLPENLFTTPYSTVLLAGNGELLSATIATDGQWRFPASDSVPDKFAEALTTFEDKRFRGHPGVDLLSLGRAMKQNLQAGKIVSGGSTITMQVIRLSRKNKSRTFLEKCFEGILSTRLELRYSKNDILNLYAAHAPFGGNVVGVEAACWRYFGTAPDDLSWAQASLLAVLPNAPSLIYPGKNRARLKVKRDKLLDNLSIAGKIDRFTADLAKQEPIPDAPFPLPAFARHLLVRAMKEKMAERKIVSTIDFKLQQRVEQILSDHHERLKSNQIFNGAALVLDVKSGVVRAYAGNISRGSGHENDVDIITSSRSTGSILKPFLYAAMLDEGKILPKTLLPDVPLLINGFAPKNFTHQYDGAVHANHALIRSLNVPAVYMLKEYRYEKFHSLLKEMGMTTLSQPPDHYGLSLILGGAEGSLWDITGMYASMARTLTNYFEVPGQRRYRYSDVHGPVYLPAKNDDDVKSELTTNSVLSAASVFFTFDALKEVYRPGEQTGWRYFNNSKDIAWKTGTSFGFRDGWAVGVTPDYAVGVWIGNADGEGRPGLTGSEAAAPVMFDIFSQLPTTQPWFDTPSPEIQLVITCRASGHRASPLCTERDTLEAPANGMGSVQCPYHRTIHLSMDSKFQVHDQCASLSEMKHVNWFVLPPVQEFYFRFIHASYKHLPPLRLGCEDSQNVSTMDMVYPKNNTRLLIPRELDGESGSSVFELAHRDPLATVFWHLDGKFVGSTTKVHHLPLSPATGKHILTIVDEKGISIERNFEVISKM